MASLLSLQLLAAWLSFWTLATTASPGKQPNFVYIMTDDQDNQLHTLAYQPLINKHLALKGTHFRKHYCTIAVCCPSRVSLLTGKMAHNTNVTDVTPPYGGYPKFISQGLNDNYLPVWLQQAGYQTYYTGKLMNAHSLANWNTPFPAGWNHTGFMIDPGTYSYYNTCWQADTSAPRFRPGEYSTDIVANQTLEWLSMASSFDQPFFIGVTPIGPHSQGVFPAGGGPPYFEAPVPAVRHQNLFPGVQVPRNANFNPSVASGASYISKLPMLNSTEVEYIDQYYRARLQSLQAVDELVDAVVERLDSLNLLDNTYIIYTSDNGYHLGQHRLPPGKSCAFEEDVNVPFLIRGPGIPKNHIVDFTTSHTDIAPTLFDLAGIPLRSDFDGTPMPLTFTQMKHAESSPMHDHVAIEFWGNGGAEGIYSRGGVNGSYTQYPNNTYKAVRIVNEGYSLMYSVWCTNEHELYDMTVDPYQMNNLYSSASAIVLGYPIRQIEARLDALVIVLKACKGSQCTTPWLSIHPDGSVNNLRDAMNPKYNVFYATQPKIVFTTCALGYFPALEGVSEALVYHLGD